MADYRDDRAYVDKLVKRKNPREMFLGDFLSALYYSYTSPHTS